MGGARAGGEFLGLPGCGYQFLRSDLFRSEFCGAEDDTMATTERGASPADAIGWAGSDRVGRRLFRAWGAWLAVCLATIFGGVGCSPSGEGLAAPGSDRLLSARAEVGQQLLHPPDFEFEFDLQDVLEQPLRKQDFRGRVLLVDIWGTWCPPCRQEIPTFIALEREYGPRGLSIVGLNQERGQPEAAAQTVRAFRKAQGIPYPCGLLTRPMLAQVPNFVGFPTTLLFDRTGQLRLRFDGYHEPVVLQAAVEALLAESPGPGGAQ